MDELFKKAVEEKEANATLSFGKKEELWGNIHREEKPSTLRYWKIACAILLLLLSGSVYRLSDSLVSKNELATEIANLQSTLSEIESQESPKEVAVETTPEAKILAKDTIIQRETEYVYRDKVVYKTIEKPVYVENNSDSLLNEIALRDELIADLNNTKAVDQKATPNEDLKNNPIDVAFQQNNNFSSDKEEKEGKLKFQLSFINLK